MARLTWAATAVTSGGGKSILWNSIRTKILEVWEGIMALFKIAVTSCFYHKNKKTHVAQR